MLIHAWHCVGSSVVKSKMSVVATKWYLFIVLSAASHDSDVVNPRTVCTKKIP